MTGSPREISPLMHLTTTQKTPKKETDHSEFWNLDDPEPPSNIEIVIEYRNRSPAPAHVYRHTFIDEATDYRDSQAYIVKNSENCAQENPTGYRRTDHPTKKVFHQENNPATKSRKSY